MSWNTDQRFPQFEVDGIKFMLTLQEDDFGNDVVLLMYNNNAWTSWGGLPNEKGIIVEGVNDEKIMAKGSLHAFITWCAEEAVRRAKIKAQIPLPDPNNRIDRLKYNLLQSIESDGTNLTVKPAPLP